MFDQGHSYEQLSMVPQQNMATNTVSQQGSQRQEQSERLYWRQSDIAQRAAVKCLMLYIVLTLSILTLIKSLWIYWVVSQ